MKVNIYAGYSPPYLKYFIQIEDKIEKIPVGVQETFPSKEIIKTIEII